MFLGWSTKSYTFIAAWGEFCTTLEEVIVLTDLLLFGEVRTIELLDDSEEISLDGEGERKLESLKKVLSKSKLKTNSTYSSSVRYFTRELVRRVISS